MKRLTSILYCSLALWLLAACSMSATQPTPSATMASWATPTSYQPSATATTIPTVIPTAIATKSAGLIAYVGTNKDYNLFVVNLDGTQQVKLTDSYGSGSLHSVALSPDGHQVLFVVGYGATQIYAANTDGSGLRSLTEDEAGSDLPAWSPDGQTIAYTAFDSTGLHRIYLMSKDGTNKRLLTTGSGYEEYSPTWSPRGDRIAFTAEITNPPEYVGGVGHLRVVNIDGTHEMTLTAEVENIDSPEWSPSGQWIVFTGWNDARKATIFHLISPDGSSPLEPKVEGYSDLLYPIWSPDGTQVVFVARPVDQPRVLHLILMTIPDLTWGKLAEKVDEFERCWTFDGNQILYRVWDVGKDAIWAIKPDGSGAYQLPKAVGGLDDCIPK